MEDGQGRTWDERPGVGDTPVKAVDRVGTPGQHLGGIPQTE